MNTQSQWPTTENGDEMILALTRPQIITELFEMTQALPETTVALSELNMPSSAMTKTPYETTKAHSETTKARAETTKEPPETTRTPSETTKAPSETTKAPSKARATHTNKENKIIQGDTSKTKAHAPSVKKRNPMQKNENLKFYRGEIKSKKWFGGKKIDEMLTWKGNYTELERNHSYIQWLFPIPEASRMNLDAQPLQEHEAQAINLDTDLSNKVLKAYKMMLDFYGMKLASMVTGDVARSANWKERYKHLNKSVHNRLRISRIIRSLGCLGFKHLQVPWLKLIIHEAVKTKELPALDCSSLPHWIEAISEKVSREYMWQVYYDLKGFGANVSRESVLEAGPEDEGLEEGSDVDGAVGPGEEVGGKEAGEEEEGIRV